MIDRVWGSDYVGDTKTLDVHIKRLRAKVEPNPANPTADHHLPRPRLQVRPVQGLTPAERPGSGRPYHATVSTGRRPPVPSTPPGRCACRRSGDWPERMRLMTAGDVAMVVSLAGSLFFSISPDAARSKVLLYLLVSFAPFAVVAPLIGPFIDRRQVAGD